MKFNHNELETKVTISIKTTIITWVKNTDIPIMTIIKRKGALERI